MKFTFFPSVRKDPDTKEITVVSTVLKVTVSVSDVYHSIHYFALPIAVQKNILTLRTVTQPI